MTKLRIFLAIKEEASTGEIRRHVDRLEYDSLSDTEFFSNTDLKNRREAA
jgi:hypothetical protein